MASKREAQPGVIRGDRRLLSPAEVAVQLDKPEKTLAQWRWLKRGPSYIRLEGGEVRYRQSDVDAWLDTQTVTTGTALA